jgi:hypothetical protein
VALGDLASALLGRTARLDFDRPEVAPARPAAVALIRELDRGGHLLRGLRLRGAPERRVERDLQAAGIDPVDVQVSARIALELPPLAPGRQ